MHVGLAKNARDVFTIGITKHEREERSSGEMEPPIISPNPVLKCIGLNDYKVYDLMRVFNEKITV